MKDGITEAQILEILAYLAGDVVASGLIAAISNVASAIINEEAQAAATLISADSPDISGLVVEWVNGIPDRVDGIAAVTLEQIKEILTESLNEGWGLSVTARAISDLFGNMNQSRAQTIALTEVQGATNFAAWSVFKRAGVPFKRWMAVGDDRTRDSHAQVNGYLQAIDLPFHVGGFPIMYPCDPAGPAREVVNCRCWIIPEFARALLSSVWRVGTLGALKRSLLRRSTMWETHMTNALRDEFTKQRNHVLSILKQ